jgi:hypothetical protein
MIFTTPRDAILPIYDPKFLPASQAGLRDDELVLGVAWGGAAKAYPISVLNTREMVNDGTAGHPHPRHLVTTQLYRSRARPADPGQGDGLRQPGVVLHAGHDLVGP